MLSIPVQSSIKGTLTCPPFLSRKPCTIQSKDSIFWKPRAFSPHISTIFHLKCRPIRRIHKLRASAATEEAVLEDTVDSSAPPDPVPIQEPKKLTIGGKQIQKPKLVLKFIWMEKNIGLALDQELPGHGTVPLCPYFFWPRKDAWEELKTTLESKPWISQKKMIILLNQATDIINLWQQSGGNLT